MQLLFSFVLSVPGLRTVNRERPEKPPTADCKTGIVANGQIDDNIVNTILRKLVSSSPEEVEMTRKLALRRSRKNLCA